MKNLFTFFLSIITFFSASAWSQKGHDTIAYIAEQHLSPEAYEAVTTLLQGRSMIYWANWLDNASNTPEYEYSKTWHYKNIDADQTYEESTINPKGDIVTALNTQIAVLADTTVSVENRRLALKMIIHLVGDLHQPMHMGHASDYGGNTIEVSYFGTKRKLHGIWDSQLVESAHRWSYTEWQYNIDRISPEMEAEIGKGTIDDWGKETYLIAEKVYDYFRPNSKVSYDAVAKWTPVIERQFLYGGIRLAKVLNDIFKQQ